MESEYKPGGVGMVSFQSVAGRIKENGQDRLGRYCYQVFDSGSDFHSVIFSVYRCNKTTLKDSKKTAYRQQLMLQSELGYRGDPTRYFKDDLIREIKKLQRKYGTNLCPYILGDFNDCPRIQQAINDICHEFQLVDIFLIFIQMNLILKHNREAESVLIEV